MPPGSSNFLLQSTYGRAGNFELVTDDPNDGYQGLVHRWRNNDDPGMPWIYAGHFFRRRYVIRRPALIQDSTPGSGRLQAVAFAAAPGAPLALRHFTRENGPTWAWREPVELPESAGLDYTSNPALVETTHAGPVRQLEVFAGVRGGGIERWSRTDAGWRHRGRILTELGQVDAIAAVESNFGRLELLVRRGTGLDHLGRGVTDADTAWSAPVRIVTGAVGVPGFIQGRFGRNGNYEVATANSRGGLTGTWCDTYDPANPRWMGEFQIFDRVEGTPGETDSVALIQSRYGTPGLGNLELVLRRGGTNHFAWRIDQPPWTWAGPWRMSADPPDCGPLLRRPDTLERRLSGCDDLRSEIGWETPTGARVLYDDWPRARKDRLNELFQRLVDGRELGLSCPDPAANMSLRPRSSGATCMFLTEAQAFDVYAAHVAHVFQLEATGAVGWSILDLPSAELQELLSSDRYHVRILPTGLATESPPYYPSHIRPDRDYQLPYRVQMTGKPLGLVCDPRVGYRFLRGTNRASRTDLVGATEDETLANISVWVSKTMAHGGEAVDSTREYYVAHTFLQDRLRSEFRDWGFARFRGIFAPSGCQTASNLLRDLARSVNIPLLNAKVGEPAGVHQGLLYRWNRDGTRLLHHTDDVYLANTLAPCFPVEAGGARSSEAQATRRFFEQQWTPLEVLTSFGFRHAPTYAVQQSPFTDSPEVGADGGSWASSADMSTFVLEKRYQLCSWRDFIQDHCDGRLTEAYLTRSGARLARPFADFQSRARACDAAYGGCAGLRASREAWVSASGSDVWVD